VSDNIRNKDALEETQVPSKGQRRIAIFSVVMMIPLLLSFWTTSEFIREWLQAVRPQAKYPFVPILSFLGKLCSYWFLLVPIIGVIQYRWAFKSTSRLIRFNAVFAIIMVALAWCFVVVPFSQYMLVQEQRRNR
jgi:hypothetical protein